MRLFIGIELAAEMRNALVEVQDQLRERFASGVRWTGYEQLHITLKFLGEVPEGRHGDIVGALHSAVTCCAPCRASLMGTGVFPEQGVPQVVWCGLTATFHFLWETVEHTMDVIGFPRETRALVPHITIGRIRDSAWSQGELLRAALACLEVKDEGQEIGYVSLFQSTPAEGGSLYKVLERFPLLGT